VGEQLRKLAQFVATVRWEDVPAAPRQRTKLVLLDTLGIMLAGSLRPEVRGLSERLAATRGTGATVFGPGWQSADPRTAGLLNSMSGRSLEMSEGLRGLQAAVHVVPAIVAISESLHSSGKQLLQALVLGYEFAGRLSRGYTPRALSHPNGQISLLASVAAAARLYELDGAGVDLSVRIATAMLMTPSYNNTAAGGTNLNLAAGMGSFAAGLAPEMALAGYVAPENAIEEALDKLVGAAFTPDAVADNLGTAWEISDNYFRFYACCNPIHPCLDSLQDVLATLRPQPEEIARIDAETFAFATVMSNQDPPNYFASKYSFPHAAATLAVRHDIGFSDMDDSALIDPIISALRHRVFMTEDPKMTALGPTLKPARVTVTLTDGRQATASCENSRRDTFRPDPEAQVREKFRELAATILSSDGVAHVEAAVDRCEDWKSVEELTVLLRRYGRSVTPC
jgi:2-methylcitrate dehydratase PrpD